MLFFCLCFLVECHACFVIVSLLCSLSFMLGHVEEWGAVVRRGESVENVRQIKPKR